MIVLTAARLAGYRYRRTIERATLVRITRTDGVEHRMNDHDQPIDLRTVNPPTFPSTPGLSCFSERRQVGLGDNTTEIRGIVDSVFGLAYDDLRAGRFEDCVIEKWEVNWNWPLAPHNYSVWYPIGGSPEFDEMEWRFDLGSIKSRLKQKRGEVFGGLCQNTLGVAGGPRSFCAANVIVYPFTVAAATVTSTVAPTARLLTCQKTGGTGFNSGGAHVEGYFDFGHARWLTGKNAGLIEKIEESDPTGTSTEQQLKMARPLPFVPLVGDTLDVVVGCDKRDTTCFAKFNQLVSFRGAPHTPGMREVIRTPRAT